MADTTDRTPLSAEKLSPALATLPGWTASVGYLEKTYRCRNFRAAIELIAAVVDDCEALDHHPEIRNVYRQTTFALTTHSAGNQITPLDVALAARIEARAAPFVAT